ncbi:phage tail tube protein [Humibacter ginsenosidimutans]|uniref:IPT/TIG domain-containing protein n=1 Tax=Humibacter ginsenosidimutans TaxID=2599293 RepID=A0A5B8M6N3_9MICO|nr:IPT/TIG domain-containing protein [Humibacter ginsenosidimutans]QDZ15779.1 hypothetical protein FPZ11_14315 [Humibacter ginsenosidimutans]
MTKSLARRWAVDLSSDNSMWLHLSNMGDFAPSETPTLQDSSDYDNDGFVSFEKTMTGGKVVVKFTRRTTAGIPSDPAQKLAQATKFKFGDDCRIYTRWYTTDGDTEAWTARTLVDWQQSKTGVADLEEVTITLTADGTITAIDSPYTPTAAPVVVSAATSDGHAAATGDQLVITGQGFTGATGVKLAAVAATVFNVMSDSMIIAVVPSGSAGSAPVKVTNGVGDSNAFPYTRAA